LTRAKDVEAAFTSLGIHDDLARVRDSRSIRAGKANARRKRKQALVIIVVCDGGKLVAAAITFQAFK
jgi:hypothetical protein